MSRWKRAACLIIMTSLLFTLAACAPSLYSKKEVLEILSEQYGEEFIIIETLNSSLYSITPRNFSVESRLYSAAPRSDPENIFWVRQDVVKHGGLFATYENTVEDTWNFDRFLKRFGNFLQDNKINSFFTTGNEEKELTEYLAEPHLQGGRIYVSIAEDTAEEIVTQIFNFIDAFYGEYPSKDRFHFTRLAICFYDDSKITRQELDESYLSLDELYLSLPHYGLYGPSDDDETDVESMLKEINEFYYSITTEKSLYNHTPTGKLPPKNRKNCISAAMTPIPMKIDSLFLFSTIRQVRRLRDRRVSDQPSAQLCFAFYSPPVSHTTYHRQAGIVI